MNAGMNATLRARQYNKLGLDMPEEATRLLVLSQAATAASSADPMQGIDVDALTTENVTEALRQAALTQAVKAGMRELAADIDNQIGQRINRALAADLDRVIKELRPRFIKAAAVVTDAIANGLTSEVYGDARRVMDAGPAAAGLFHNTRDALVALEAITSFLRPAMVPGNDVATVVDLTPQASLDALAIAQATFTGPGGNERLLALFEIPGIKPALNTNDQARAVVAAVARARQADADGRKAAEVKAAQDRAAAWTRLSTAGR